MTAWTVITGANSGIGYATALRLAELGHPLVLAGRAEARHHRVLAAIAARGGTAQFVDLDLGNFDSIRAAAATIVSSGRSLGVLINNAGVGGRRGVTASGFEVAFGTNHLGHYLWTRLLLPALEHRGRVVNVSSKNHFNVDSIDWDAVQTTTSTMTGMREYSTSKLANVLFSMELARRLPVERGNSCSLHPGRVDTNIWKPIPRPVFWLMKNFRPLITQDQGAQTSVHCALDASIDAVRGGYYDRCALRPCNPAAGDALARELWQRSAAWVGLPESLSPSELQGRATVASAG